jgi:hypothetical protein
MMLTLTNCNSTKGEIEMNTEQIMHMVYDYADAFHNRVDSIGEVDTPTQKELKHSQMEIGKQIKAAIEALLQERDALKAALTKAKAMPMKYRRMGFNAQLQHEANKLAAELKALRDSGVELPIWTLLHRQWPDSYWYGEIYGYTADQLRDYGNRRAMAERERCAKVCEEHATKYLNRDVRNQHSHGAGLGASICADAIRKGE